MFVTEVKGNCVKRPKSVVNTIIFLTEHKRQPVVSYKWIACSCRTCRSGSMGGCSSS